MIDKRILGAMAIALAGILFGFTTGRLSAWLVPPAGMTSLAPTAKPSVPLKPVAPVKQAASTPSDAAGVVNSAAKPTSADAAAGSPGTPSEPVRTEAKQTETPTDSKPKASEVGSRALSPGEPQGGTSWQDADTKLINPGSTQRSDRPQDRPAFDPATRLSEGRGDDMRTLTSSPEGLERCRQKYRSFDPSDGTYKPYGEDRRVPCPHLSR